MDDVARFYDELADDYDAIFEDWDRAVVRQGELIAGLIASLRPSGGRRVLDATCGIGTQAIGLALSGHQVTGTDVSPRSIERAGREAARLGAAVSFQVADIRSIASVVMGPFDVAISFDNALPHLVLPEDLGAALHGLHEVCRPGGLLLASVRDYDAILDLRPSGEPPRLRGLPGRRRLTTQAWTWDRAAPTYTVHQFVLREAAEGWTVWHAEAPYRALIRRELGSALEGAGFKEVRWLEPLETGFYQPIVAATA